MDAMNHWFAQTEANTNLLWRGPRDIYHEQSRIGWRQMFRGYLTSKWQKYLYKCVKEQHLLSWLQDNANDIHLDTVDTPDSDEFVVSFQDLEQQPLRRWQAYATHMTKIIRIIWAELGTLWSNHLQYIHANEQGGSSDKHLELSNHIRVLHSYRNSTLACHRDRYFYDNVDTYLERATTTQMQRYVDHYRPVILNSIRQATKIATQSMTLYTFPGFVKQPNSTRTVHVSQEETPHRKHTRLRNLIQQQITAYFTRKQNSFSQDPPA